jgi:hypothetical protein
MNLADSSKNPKARASEWPAAPQLETTAAFVDPLSMLGGSGRNAPNP